MFEKLNRAAEKAAGAVGTSRRGFLARVGRTAVAAAAAAGGVLVAPGQADGGPKYGNLYYACTYLCKNGGYGGEFSIYHCGGCPPDPTGCRLRHSFVVGTC
jgi:hypothetical protein